MADYPKASHNTRLPRAWANPSPRVPQPLGLPGGGGKGGRKVRRRQFRGSPRTGLLSIRLSLLQKAICILASSQQWCPTHTHCSRGQGTPTLSQAAAQPIRWPVVHCSTISHFSQKFLFLLVRKKVGHCFQPF